MEDFMEAYNKLAEKYKFVLGRLDIVSSKLNEANKNNEDLIAEVKKTISDTIKEVALNFKPKN